MLSYRHGYHAGNHADVLKHMLLIGCLRHLNQKAKPYWYIDTHAGPAVHDLTGEQARKNSEFQAGIGRLWFSNWHSPLIGDYVDVIRTFNTDGELRRYPGSAAVAMSLLRADDRLFGCELHPADAQALRRYFSRFRVGAVIEQADGFAGLKAQLPPPTRRALTLIDPSYEDKADYGRVLAAVKDSVQRFATGIYLLWYPILGRRQARDLPNQLQSLSVDWLHVSLRVQSESPGGLGMRGSGMFVVNPPWRLAEELRVALPELSDLLKAGKGAGYALSTSAD